jgi:hypothetical protein
LKCRTIGELHACPQGGSSPDFGINFSCLFTAVSHNFQPSILRFIERNATDSHCQVSIFPIAKFLDGLVPISCIHSLNSIEKWKNEGFARQTGYGQDFFPIEGSTKVNRMSCLQSRLIRQTKALNGSPRRS